MLKLPPTADLTPGFAWILRPYKNSFGVVSILLIFVSILSVWLVSMMSYQYKQRYFNELSGIYPPIFARANADIDWDEIQQQVSGIKAVRKEHFAYLIDVCVDDGKGVGFRPVRSGIRTLAPDTLNEQALKYGATDQPGIWMSSALYEVIFGEPYVAGANTAQQLGLIGKLKRRKGHKFNRETCQTNGPTVQMPIIKVIPLAHEARWLIIKVSDTRSLNLSRQLTRISSVYTDTLGWDEWQIFQQIALLGPVNYWIDELPADLQINLERLETRFFIFLLLTFVMVLSFLFNLYLMTQKTFQQSFYLLRHYGVSKRQFFTHVAVALWLFWLIQSGLSFIATVYLLSILQPELFSLFSPLDYLQSLSKTSLAVVMFCSLLLPLTYLLPYFFRRHYNERWKGIQP